MIPDRIYDRCRLHRWSSAYRKYINPSQIQAFRIYENAYKTDCMYFQLNGGIFTLSCQVPWIKRSDQIHRKKCLIYWKQWQHTQKESVDCYWKVIELINMEIWSLWLKEWDFLSSYGRVSTPMWLHHLEFQWIFVEIARWRHRKNLMCRFE